MAAWQLATGSLCSNIEKVKPIKYKNAEYNQTKEKNVNDNNTHTPAQNHLRPGAINAYAI